MPMNVNSDSNNVVHLEVGKLYMLALNSNRQYYWLYGDAYGTARVNVAEPFLVIGPSVYVKPGFVLSMVSVCNARGEIGLIDPKDVVDGRRPAFVPYVGPDDTRNVC